ncbi:hypothetical protein [Actinoallomurus sp. NPDC052274]|uniref:hypothetical protein n=1 Tax=Actinoallomurus sp. NPDC052274 TaxID=3155420 RepID=UPI0034212F5F
MAVDQVHGADDAVDKGQEQPASARRLPHDQPGTEPKGMSRADSRAAAAAANEAARQQADKTDAGKQGAAAPSAEKLEELAAGSAETKEKPSDALKEGRAATAETSSDSREAPDPTELVESVDASELVDSADTTQAPEQTGKPEPQDAPDLTETPDLEEAPDAEGKAETAKAALRESGSSVPDDQIDGLVNRAKDDPDPSKAEIGKKDVADALDEITDLARRDNVNGDAAAALEGKVANASDANKLAEARAEVNAVRRAADDAAPGSLVDAGVGAKMNRKEANLGNGERVDLDQIPDADVVFKDKSGTVNVNEVKNAGSATRKADFANQVERLKRWADKEPDRKATVEIETTDRWTSIFSEFKPARNGKPAKDSRTAAGEMARNGLDAKVAGQSLSADQLGKMQRAIDERTAHGTMDWAKMKDPDSAKAYLGIE